MAGVNSLGIGSGVLTSDLIDKLRAADESSIIAPFERKITLENQKEEAYNLLSSLMTTFKSSTSSLDGDSLYLSRAVSGTTDAVSIKAEAGSDVQSFNITNVSKAEKDVWNSSVFSNTDSAISEIGAGTLSIGVGEDSFDIEYSATSSLEDMKNSINDIAGGKMTASILKVGDDKFELVITADKVNQALTFSDTNTDTDPLAKSLISTLGLNETVDGEFTRNIQKAKAATFNYNGIAISRSSNEIDDLINGVTISLNQNQKTDERASIDIAQNNTSITSEMSLFVSAYNMLMSNLSDMTSSDTESGSVGVFNNDSFIKSLSKEISSIVTSVDRGGNSLMDYGISIDRKGVMSLNNDTFASKLAKDPTGLEMFFNGNSETDGVFTKLNNKMGNYLGNGKLMSNFSDQLTTKKDSLVQQYDKQKLVLDDRYETMSKKFAAYDSIINKLNSQFSSLKMMIDAEANSSN